MSYARWSNSAWYAFYNVNGKLSLWYDMDHCYDLTYEDCQGATEKTLVEVYGCTEAEAREAMAYISYFIEDYDPKDGEEYDKQLKEFMEKLENLKNDER